jgi:hypothetical protein
MVSVQKSCSKLHVSQKQTIKTEHDTTKMKKLLLFCDNERRGVDDRLSVEAVIYFFSRAGFLWKGGGRNPPPPISVYVRI